MSGVHRLLTRKDKKHNKEQKEQKEKTVDEKIEYGDLGAIFVPDTQKKKPDKDEEKKIKAIQARLQTYGITKINHANIEYALHTHSVAGNVDEAFRLCLLLEDTYEGLLKAYDPDTKLLGAVNREGVTCYLDALLFAMFARLDGFEAMLYNSLEDAPRKKLGGLLRLWVNMLRTGRLITVDVTKHVQAALAECGWEAANRTEQQDTSEAFSFITGQLEMPLLTLKMDLYHTGKEEPDDDHKFVNERLLEVAVLDAPRAGQEHVTLEDCLEHYFNNRVEVKRHLERQRRMTQESVDRVLDQEKTETLRVETVEVIPMAESATVETPRAGTPSAEILAAEAPKKGPVERLRPSVARSRADSIFSQRRVKVGDGTAKPAEENAPSAGDEKRKGSLSTRTEVLMPAWQFFKLLPWYTDNMPTSDAQVAAHFALKRPTLGICLKRYMVTNEGQCERMDTFIDIPLEIAVPDFVSDDSMGEGSPLVGNFKLVLQSVVCHRGKSVHSGHYISLVRGHAANAVSSPDQPAASASDHSDDSWMLFDDLARERVRYVDIASALKEECPYLLFYQVQPIDDDEPIMSGPPSYDEAVSRTNSEPLDPSEKIALPEYSDSDGPYAPAPDPASRTHLSATEPPSRTSIDDPRGRPSTSSERRRSIAFDQADRSSIALTTSGPPTPADESRLDFLKLPSRRGSRQSSGRKTKSRPPSVGADAASRFSLNMSRLTTRMSKTDLPPVAASPAIQEPEMGGTVAVDHETGVETVVPAEKLRKKDKHPAHHAQEDSGAAAMIGRKIRRKGEVPDRDCRVM
ncbi:cysteine proteinase [Myriangium duriaei CBS 260.36]|uniref:ubiquitinyl hydrolase 1 n=1 Tax=Myriangium duriaei CBS 260.36 TaxID=1168546 RepID=A0A9P4IWN4_9PEZI|nr:cysteine proteinase [Myriangium duriaei CBS 260.36]